MFAGCLQIMWAHYHLIRAEGVGYSQLIRAENTDVCRSYGLCLQAVTANGSELVLFDINRNIKIEQLFRPSIISTIDHLLPRPPRLYQATMITSAAVGDNNMVARSIKAGARHETVEPLGLDYPTEIFSLSHVALPFPVTDPLYGSQPENPAQYGINLGDMAVRGERSVLIVDLDTLLRVSSNPFFSYMLQRIDADIPKKPSEK